MRGKRREQQSQGNGPFPGAPVLRMPKGEKAAEVVTRHSNSKPRNRKRWSLCSPFSGVASGRAQARAWGDVWVLCRGQDTLTWMQLMAGLRQGDLAGPQGGAPSPFTLHLGSKL